MGPMEASSIDSTRCAFPNGYANSTLVRPASRFARHHAWIAPAISGIGSPTINGQREGRFRDERVTAQRFEGRAGRIGRQFVIAGDHPHFAAAFDANLRRTEDVPGRMQRDSHIVHRDAFAIFEGLNRTLITDARPQQRRASARGQITLRPCAGMIGMGVSDYGARDGTPRVDMKAPGGTI